jgi:hypothetical protein
MRKNIPQDSNQVKNPRACSRNAIQHAANLQWPETDPANAGKVKQFLRSAEARTGEELQQAIAAALACVTAQDAMNWFASCGYSFI